VEITIDAVSENEKHLRHRLRHLIKTYKQPVLVEEFIVGREDYRHPPGRTQQKSLHGRKGLHTPLRKIHFRNLRRPVADRTGRSLSLFEILTTRLLKEYIKKAFDVTKACDYGKFDIRIDQSGRYFFIDTNSNPAFGPKELDMAMAVILDLYGVSFVEILKRLMLNTVQRLCR
jgi:hypothetical protein